MAAMKTIIELCKIQPADLAAPDHSPSSSPTSLPLTFFDILWLRLPPVQRIFFYNFPHPPSIFFNSLLPKFKLSLSISLYHFLPLSGHLTWPHNSPVPIITFNNSDQKDAASLVIAESHADFHILSGFDRPYEATQCHHLIPHLNASHDRASVMALQITLFPNSGFSVAISTHHAVIDGKISTLFLKSWAYICNHLQESSSSPLSSSVSLPPELTPSFDRSSIKDTMNLASRFSNDWMNHGGPNNKSLELWNLPVPNDAVRGVFDLPRPHIERLKRYVAFKNKNNNLHLSTFIVCCAYSLVCRVKAESLATSKKSMRIQLAMNVDCRTRLDPPLPVTYFGNCIGNRLAVAETAALTAEDGLVVAVEAMVKELESLKDGVLNNGSKKWVSLLQGGLGNEVRIIGMAGTPRFEVYKSDFGWGKPKKVEMASLDRTGAMCLSDSRNGDGGIEIGVVLERNVMEDFASHFHKGLEDIHRSMKLLGLLEMGIDV